MQVKYNTVALLQNSKNYNNGKLEAEITLINVPKHYYKNNAFYECYDDRGYVNKTAFSFLQYTSAAIIVYYSKYKNQNIKSELFNTQKDAYKEKNNIDTFNSQNKFTSEHYYSIEVPKGFCQISEANKKIIKDSLLSLQNKKTTKLITDAIFVNCNNEDEFPRFTLSFLPVENYETVTFKQGIGAIININLATEFDKLKSRFNFIDSLSVKNPAVDYNKQAFLFSSSG